MAIKVKIDLDADTQKLSDAIQRGVAKGFQGGGTQGLATNPAQVARQIAGTTGAGMRGYGDTMGGTSLPFQHDFTRGLGNAFLMSGGKPPPFPADVARQMQQQGQAQRAQFLKNIGFAGIPLLSPGSLLGNLFASRQIFSAASGPVGQRILGGVGLAGTAGAVGATGGIMAILLAVGASLKLLEKTVRATVAAYDEARKLYAKSLLSGLGLQFTVGRKTLAEILGVSENEVLKFGAATAILGPKLKFASDIIARTTPNLTSVVWQFGILKTNMEALFFTLANDAAPYLRKFGDILSNFIVILIRGIQELEKHKFISDFFKALAGGGILDLLGKDIGAAPQPQGQMKQLPVSALERMGLVVGGFGITNDAPQRTAKATERSAKLLEKIASTISSTGAVGFGDSFMNSP